MSKDYDRSNNGVLVLGRTPAGTDVWFDPWQPAHTLITGQTRSGKSVQIYGMLAQLFNLAEPGAIVVGGIDPTGILFNAIGDHLGGPRWRALTLADPDRVRKIMEDLLTEMDQRITGLLGAGLDKLTAFTQETPLIIVLMEEYPGTLSALHAIDQATGAKPGDRIETMVRAGIQRLALEGAKVGIRLWMVAQRADASLLTGVLRSQLTERISFRQDPDGVRMLHEGLDPEDVEKVQGFAVGRGLFESAGTGVTEFQADLIEYEQMITHFKGAPVPVSRKAS